MHQKIFILITLCSINCVLAMQEHSRRNPDLTVVVPRLALSREATLDRIPTPLLGDEEGESELESLPPLSKGDETSWPGTQDNTTSRSSTPHQPLDFDAADVSRPETPPFLVAARAPMPATWQDTADKQAELAFLLAQSRSSTAESTPAALRSTLFSPDSESTLMPASAAATQAPTEWHAVAIPARISPVCRTPGRQPLQITRAQNPLFNAASTAAADRSARAAFTQAVVVSMLTK